MRANLCLILIVVISAVSCQNSKNWEIKETSDSDFNTALEYSNKFRKVILTDYGTQFKDQIQLSGTCNTCGISKNGNTFCTKRFCGNGYAKENLVIEIMKYEDNIAKLKDTQDREIILKRIVESSAEGKAEGAATTVQWLRAVRIEQLDVNRF